MVGITLDRKRLVADLGVKDSPELLHEMVMLGLDVETATDDEITLDVTPNRPDLLSQPGITRALAAFLGKAPGLRSYETTQSRLKVRVDPSVKDIRPCTACAVAKSLKFDDERLRELIDIQEKLHVTFCRRRKRAAIGVYPLEAISGNITYTALPPKQIVFRPLESQKEMNAEQILKQHPKGKEFAHLLDGLPRYPIFIDSKKNVLSMPPVINSHRTGKVTLKTKDIFLEASGSDMRICEEIMRMMCAALADMGAQIQTVDVIYGKKIVRTPDMSAKKQEFYGYYANRRLGTKLVKEDFPKLLAKMGLGFEDGRIRETHYAIIPPYRVDFLHQIDVVEDLGIAFGYENLTAVLPEVATVAKESEMTLLQDKIRDILPGYGLLEAKNYHLISKEFQKRLEAQDMVTLKSCVSEEYDSLRLSLLGPLLQTLSRNKQHEYPQGFFEIGTVFAPGEDAVNESQHVAVIVAGEDYTRIRQLTDALVHAFGLREHAVFRPCEDARFLPGRAAEVLVKDMRLGILGEISPSALTVADVTVPAVACELDLHVLLELTK